jgi:hypothetical protein
MKFNDFFGILLCFRSVLMYFIDFCYRFWCFQKFVSFTPHVILLSAIKLNVMAPL